MPSTSEAKPSVVPVVTVNEVNGHYRVRTGDRRIKSPLLYLTKLSAHVGGSGVSSGAWRRAGGLTLQAPRIEPATDWGLKARRGRGHFWNQLATGSTWSLWS